MTNFTDLQKRILDGCLLGDGCIPASKSNCCFQYLSASKQHVEFVHKHFKEFCTNNYSFPKRKEVFDNRTEKTYISFWFRTRRLDIFTFERKRFYPHGIKIVPDDITLSPEMLLYWYIGDGELEKRRGHIKLHTNSFTEKDVQKLCNLLSQFSATYFFKQTNQFIIRIPHNKVNHFLEYIGDCPFDDYKYKWNIVSYKNKNIESNGMNNYSALYNTILNDAIQNNIPISKLSKKYNVPQNCIKHFFISNGIKYKSTGTRKKILQFDLNNNFIKEWKSGAEIVKELGFNASSISECCTGKIKQFNNYYWKFKEEENE